MSKQKIMIEFKKVYKSFKWSGDKKIRAVRGVNLKIRKGEVVGIYGPNGSGKTTLLRLMAEIMKPDKGKVRIEGEVMPVIDLGLGWEPELTGRENVFLFSSILGFNELRMKRDFNKIVKFSGIGKFIDLPVKKYSSGMRARLAFSTALYSEADILLFDEVLSVGDLGFRTKCEKAIKKLRDKKTIILVSHNLDQIYRFCDRMYHINDGKIIKSSNTRIKQFLKSLNIGKEFVCEASSNSMWPVIAKGDRLVIKKESFDSIRAGDVVAFSLPNLSEIIVHRVAKIDKAKKKLLTKGDANRSQDPWMITKNDYFGKVIRVKP